jgi:uncharacterized coiled-coil protein SlyX
MTDELNFGALSDAKREELSRTIEEQARVIEELQKKVKFLETVIQEMEIRWNKW